MAAAAAAGTAIAAACARDPARARAPTAHAGGDLVARAGTFERRYLATGEVDAVALAELRVPRVPAGRATIRWLAAEGVPVKKGDKVAELDNASFVNMLKEKTLAGSQAEMEARRQEWAGGIAEADKTLEVERKRAAVRRAEIDADVPAGILPKRDYLEKQMALRRARADLEKAEEALGQQRDSNRYDLQMKRIGLEKMRREIRMAEDGIKELTLRAPQGGTILVGNHHLEGRKLQVGDEVFVGATVVRMPDVGQIRVRAWLSDVDDGRVAAGMPVEVALDAFPGRTWTGKVLEIAPVAREAFEKSLRRLFQMQVVLDRSDAGELTPGLSARVEVVAEKRENAVLVPRAAIDTQSSPPRLALAAGGFAPITLGACNPQECVAAAGVERGARLASVAP